MGRDVTECNPATGLTARDPATGLTAYDDHPRRRVRHRLLSHAPDFMARDPAPAPFACARLYGTRSGTGSFRMRLTLWHAIRHRLLSHATDFMARDPAPAPLARDRLYGTRSGDRRYRTRPTLRHAIRRQTRPHATIIFYPTMSDCPDMSDDVRHRASQRCEGLTCSACAMT